MSDLNRNVVRVLNHVIPQIRQRQSLYKSNPPNAARGPPPFILAVSGLQGSGKSTWATALVRVLNEEHYIRAITVSLDDFYKTHDGLVETREQNPGNGLLRTRGQPGTHDEVLAEEFFKNLDDGQDTDLLIPFFDKSRFNGEGDRVRKDEWVRVSRAEPIEVLVFEGWCIGFQASPREYVEKQWQGACELKLRDAEAGEDLQAAQLPTLTLPDHPLNHLYAINENLRRYNDTFMGPRNFHILLHLDTDKLVNVYLWRLQQEHALIKSKGHGMTDDAVVAFVKGYMPAYELYLEQLRTGMRADMVTGGSPRQLRVLLNEKRTVLEISKVPGRLNEL